MNAKGKIALFAATVVAWIALDQACKAQFTGLVPDNQVMAGPFLGLVDIRLVHNTGAAWGIFSDNTLFLGVFSAVVCAALGLFFVVTAKSATLLQTVSFALIVAGGIGNAIDRFTQGFVTDFIEFSFVSFPVFNIADIGVTCGFALLLISIAKSWREGEQSAEQEPSK